MASIRDFERISQGGRLSPERIFFIGAVIVGCTFGVLWQNAEKRPKGLYVVNNSGRVDYVEPVPEDYRSKDEVLEFAKDAFKQTEGMDWKNTTCPKIMQAVKGTPCGGVLGLRENVAQGLLKFDARIAKPMAETYDKGNDFENAITEKRETSIIFSKAVLVNSSNPYEVVLMGNKVDVRNNKLYSNLFGVMYTVNVVDRQSVANPHGLLIMKKRDLTVSEMK